MPRFHLHIFNSTGETRDEEGEDLADIGAAERKAMEGVRSILSAEVREGLLDLRGRVEIADAAGDVLRTMSFSEFVTLHLGKAAL